MLKAKDKPRFMVQASFEYLLVFAAMILLLLVFFVLSQSQFNSVSATQSEQQAKNTVDALNAAAKEVYSEGVGARKKVYVDIPRNYDYTNSSVTNKSISIRVLNSDFVATFDFDVHGQLPATSGPQYIWVVSEGSGVRIGLSLISVSPPSIIAIMLQNSTAYYPFSVQNVYYNPVNVSINVSWNNPNVALALSTYVFSLLQNNSNSVTATLVSNNAAVGYYSGNIAVTATSGAVSETIDIPVTVEIVLPPSSGSPALAIIPSYWNETLLSNDNVTKLFSVCTNSATSVSAVTFAATGGAPGSWVSGLEALPAMAPDTCLPKTFTLSVPNGTFNGNYSGTITATGSGVPDAVDTVAMTIKVGGNITDILGPLVYSISRIPKRPFVSDPVTIRALCDDSARGNNSIKQGQAMIDGSGNWNTMIPADGAYNSPAENVSYTFNGLAFGQHNATLRCTDSLNNVGPNSTYQFNVMKEILIITHDNGASGSEQDWQDWLNTHSSKESFLWNKDVVQRNSVIDSGFNINLYATVLIADGITSGSTGVQLVTKLINYVGSGGYVILVDEAAEHSSKDLGVTSTSVGSVTQASIAISAYTTSADDIHYIGSPYALGTLTIYTTASDIYYINGFTVTTIATASSATPPTQPLIMDTGQFLFWGAEKPYRFNTNGNDLTTRVFDYAILNSTIGTS